MRHRLDQTMFINSEYKRPIDNLNSNELLKLTKLAEKYNYTGALNDIERVVNKMPLASSVDQKFIKIKELFKKIFIKI